MNFITKFNIRELVIANNKLFCIEAGPYDQKTHPPFTTLWYILCPLYPLKYGFHYDVEQKNITKLHKTLENLIQNLPVNIPIDNIVVIFSYLYDINKRIEQFIHLIIPILLKSNFKSLTFVKNPCELFPNYITNLK